MYPFASMYCSLGLVRPRISLQLFIAETQKFTNAQEPILTHPFASLLPVHFTLIVCTSIC